MDEFTNKLLWSDRLTKINMHHIPISPWELGCCDTFFHTMSRWLPFTNLTENPKPTSSRSTTISARLLFLVLFTRVSFPLVSWIFSTPSAAMVVLWSKYTIFSAATNRSLVSFSNLYFAPFTTIPSSPIQVTSLRTASGTKSAFTCITSLIMRLKLKPCSPWME